MKTITVGLIPAPELPETIASKLVKKLPVKFSENIDSDISWEVEVVPDQLTGAAGTSDEIINRAADLKYEYGWNYAVCLTDLPIFSKKEVVLGHVDDDKGVAQVSIPAFGAFPMKKRVDKSIIQMVSELYYRVNGHGKVLNDNIAEKNNRHLLKSEFRLSPIRKIHPIEKKENTDVHFIVMPRVHGRIRLLSGMSYANRPWTIIPAFKSVVAIAFATGAYGLVFTTLWNISVAYGYMRFIVMMLAAVAGMIIWIIFAHNLWEKPSGKSKRKLRMLYNAATIVTLSTAVIVYYVMLFLLFLVAVAFFVPPELFAEVVGLKEKVSFKHYLQLTWLVTSVATVAGAIGSGLEDENAVRKIMYGYRQHQRYMEMEHNDDVF
ncbi:hypothetical protein [Virgibacillus doumboii]|uniref:hypothetical protein n=1 Tax=Virgibacillus doumboii TaxID=2697503 RepID=UPI0013E02AD2|nr:hypothetical protein [Virgibacillus doumboii]